MPYDETTVERIRRILSRRRGVVERKMIGGLSFMVSGKLCCGVNRTGILIRIAPEMREQNVGAAPGAGRLTEPMLHSRCGFEQALGWQQPLPEEMSNCGVLLASL
jgi:hypothetical protein